MKKRRIDDPYHNAAATLVTGNSGQQVITNADHREGNLGNQSNFALGNPGHQVTNAESGQQLNSITGVLNDKQSNDTTTPEENNKRKNAQHEETDLAKGVALVFQQGSDPKQILTERETVTNCTEQHSDSENVGDQLIAGSAITDPVQSFPVNPMVADELAMAMDGQANERPGQQMGAGVAIKTITVLEQQADDFIVSNSAEDIVAGNEDLSVKKMQHSICARIGNKGKEAMVYVEKGNPPLVLKKPAGITIREPNNLTSKTMVERLQRRNVGNPNANAEWRMTRAENPIDATDDGNRIQQKTNAPAEYKSKDPPTSDGKLGNQPPDTDVNRIQQKTPSPANTPGTGNSNGYGTEWTVVTKTKSRRFTTNTNKENQSVETQAETTTHVEHKTDAVITGDHPH